MPVVGGDYLSMRNGPVTSELLDLINDGRLYQESDTRWEQCISDRENHDILLLKAPECEQVSNAEVKLVDEIWAEHAARSQWQLAEWCHEHCAEWAPLASGCAPISVEQIGKALGKDDGDIAHLTREARELNRLHEIFAHG